MIGTILYDAYANRVGIVVEKAVDFFEDDWYVVWAGDERKHVYSSDGMRIHILEFEMYKKINNL